MKTSGAVQIRDLVGEAAASGHKVTVLLPDPGLDRPWLLEEQGNTTVLRLATPATKDVSYFYRAIAEYRLASCMYRNFLKSPLASHQWDGLVWYSPTIFFGPLVRKLKPRCGNRAYLILRDIFPEWAVDMGLLRRGFIYRYFKRVERFQYLQADTIGVQTPSVTRYFEQAQQAVTARIEVLPNWLRGAPVGACSIDIAATTLAGRNIFVYTGNIGIAQGMDILVDLANALRDDRSAGFVFVGRGTAVERIRNLAVQYHLDNVLFFDEIPPEEIPGLLAQCQAGLVALDPRHRNDNIPGKFLAYMQAGLPVLATINPGNDLEHMIREYRVGEVVTDGALASLVAGAHKLLAGVSADKGITGRCRDLAKNRFSAATAVAQIVAALGTR